VVKKLIFQELPTDIPLEMGGMESTTAGLQYLMWIPAITIIPIIGFMIFYTLRSFKTKQTMYYYLTLLFLCSAINHLFSMNFFIMDMDWNTNAYKISQIAEVSSSFLLLLILQMFENSRIVSKISTFFTLNYSIIIYAIITYDNMDIMQIGTKQSMGFTQGSDISILIAVFSLVAILWSMRIYLKDRKGMQDKTQKPIINFLFLGIILTMALGSFLPSILEFLMSGNSFARMNNFTSFRVLGLIFVGMGYSKIGERTWLMQRQKNEFLIVYNKAGIPLYQRAFNNEISEENMSLFSGAFSAVTTMFQQTANISEPIEAIQFKGKILKVITSKNFYCMLMTDYLSPVSVQALQKFSDIFAEKFQLLLQESTGECVALEPANKISEIYFP